MATEKVFISYTHSDVDKSMLVRDALTQWGVNVWFDDSDANAKVGHGLADGLLASIQPCDILIRLRTPATPESVWIQRELGMYLAFQHDKSLHTTNHPGKLINICFQDYLPDGLDHRYLFINAGEKPVAA